MNLEDQPKIRVVVRKRPLTKKEILKNQQDIVEIRDGTTVIVREMKQKVDLTKYIDEHHFNFDSTFDQTINNQTIYLECVRPIVQSAFQGAKVTCFAYGQTGSGKTYTMNGDPQSKVAGMYILGAQDIFHIRDQPHFRHLTVSMSFYQIYCGRLHDLLNNRQVLQARQDAKQNVNIVGLIEKKINNVQNFMQVIQQGSAVRITSQNSTNADSSRSHAILQISLLDGKKIFGKISFIDLAGCQRGADTIDQNKQTRIDGSQINKSLLALKQCIRALDNGKSHTPFRGSKLTMVLKDSFVGFCKTLMIGNISPNFSSCQNTLNTLRYADRVKQLKKNSNEYVSKQDQLAKQLMLPRMLRNKQTVNINEDDGDIQQKLFAPRKIQSTKMQQQKPRTNRDGKHSKKKEISALSFQNNQNYIQNKQNRQQKKNYGEALKANNNIINNQQQVNINLKPNTRNNAAQNQQMLRNNSLPNRNSIILTQNNKILNPSQNNLKTQINMFESQKNPLENQDYKNWETTLQQFRIWHPSNSRQVDTMQKKFGSLVNYLVKEQMQVVDHHKNEIEFTQNLQNESIKLFNGVLQEKKSNQQLMNYTQCLQSLVDKKINFLFNIKNKLESYKYHLKEHQFCQKKLLKASEQIISLEEEQISLLDQDNDQSLYQNDLQINQYKQQSRPAVFQNLNNFQIVQPIQRYPQPQMNTRSSQPYYTNNYMQNQNRGITMNNNSSKMYWKNEMQGYNGNQQIQSLFGRQNNHRIFQ